MAFWKTRTLTEMAVSAVDQIAEDVADLYGERQDALSCFRCTAERLQKINDQLDETLFTYVLNAKYMFQTI